MPETLDTVQFNLSHNRMRHLIHKDKPPSPPPSPPGEEATSPPSGLAGEEYRKFKVNRTCIPEESSTFPHPHARLKLIHVFVGAYRRPSVPRRWRSTRSASLDGRRRWSAVSPSLRSKGQGRDGDA